MITKQRLLLSSTALAGMILLASGPVLAQSTQPPSSADGPPPPTANVPSAVPETGSQAQDEPAAVQEVIVTGSRIRRDPTNSPTPLIQVQREALLQSGQPNIIDVLADIPALQASQTPEDTTGAVIGQGGLSLLDLRNLGADRTLTLVDGRRHVGSRPGSAAVDIDTIPTLLIENLEVVTGGQSALYGADAVSGVANFVLRRDFEGVEVDTSFGQINQGSDDFNRRVSALAGKSFLDGRAHAYVTGEYVKSDEVRDEDLDLPAVDDILLNNDTDPAGLNNDNQPDNVLFRNARSLSRPRGGILTLAHGTPASPTSDPDIPFANCPATGFSGNCFPIDPPYSFLFDNNGVSRPVNFGTARDQNGLLRTTVIGGDGDRLTAFQDSRLPESEAYRFQTGGTFELFEGLELFGEAKYVKEETLYDFQPAFFEVGIRPFAAGEPTQVSDLIGFTSFQIGLDNAYLDPALRSLIQNNQRPVFAAPTADAPSVQTGTVADPRAQLRLFTRDLGGRPALNERELQRYVVGVRGDREQLFNFVNNFSYELGYTYGRVEDENSEFRTVDIERLAFSIDAVRDVNNVTGKGANAIVCRAQLLTAQGQLIDSAATDADGVPLAQYNAQSPIVQGCLPSRIFGEGGLTPATGYILTDLTATNRNEQHDVLGFASGEFFENLPAGPIGIALGAEYRKEIAQGTSEQFPGRFLFANALANFGKQEFDVTEFFGEVRVPLLRDLPFAESLEVNGAYRTSNYSTLGVQETYSASLNYRPVQDLLFRASYGKSVRSPNLSELYAPFGQDFPNPNDNCSSQIIATTADQRIKENRIRNCALLGIPASYLDPNPTSSNNGQNGGNPNLDAEEGESYTASIVLTPRFIPNFSLVLDYYEIDITNSIVSLTGQQIIDNCTDLDGGPGPACSLISRGTPDDEFEISNLIIAPVNFAALKSRGLDFSARYNVDLEEVTGRNLGELLFTLSGNYLIRREDFVDPTNPGDADELDSTLDNPRVRFRTGVTYSINDFGLTWEVDHQTAQELFDSDLFLQDVDNRDPRYLDTGSFTQHDFTVRYDYRNIRLRAGVVNAFDEEPTVQSLFADNFDLFGRRFFVGANVRFGEAAEQARRN